MLVIADLIAYFTNLSILLLLILKPVLNLSKNKIVRTLTLLTLGLGFILLPCYQGMTLVQILRGTFGDLSLTGLLVLCLLGLCGVKNINPIIFLPKPLCVFLVTLGAVLYLATFSYIKIDLYALGFAPTTSVLCIFFLIELLTWYISPLFAIIWLIALIAFYFQLQTSINLWDYLLDPLLWLIMIRLLFKKKTEPINA